MRGSMDLLLPGAPAARAALADFVRLYREHNGGRLWANFDPDWRSPCEIGKPDAQGHIAWAPVPRNSGADDFQGLERALEIPIHADIKAYYGSFWSGHLEAEFAQRHISLLLLWNTQDAERLIGNLIGHALEKKRRKFPLTLFFACAEPDCESFLSVDNVSGVVLLESPGSGAITEIAEDLPTFFRALTPAIPAPPVGRNADQSGFLA